MRLSCSVFREWFSSMSPVPSYCVVRTFCVLNWEAQHFIDCITSIFASCLYVACMPFLFFCRQQDEFGATKTLQTPIFEDYYEGNMRTPVHFHAPKVIKAKGFRSVFFCIFFCLDWTFSIPTEWVDLNVCFRVNLWMIGTEFPQFLLRRFHLKLYHSEYLVWEVTECMSYSLVWSLLPWKIILGENIDEKRPTSAIHTAVIKKSELLTLCRLPGAWKLNSKPFLCAF